MGQRFLSQLMCRTLVNFQFRQLSCTQCDPHVQGMAGFGKYHGDRIQEPAVQAEQPDLTSPPYPQTGRESHAKHRVLFTYSLCIVFYLHVV